MAEFSQYDDSTPQFKTQNIAWQWSMVALRPHKFLKPVDRLVFWALCFASREQAEGKMKEVRTFCKASERRIAKAINTLQDIGLIDHHLNVTHALVIEGGAA